MLPIRQACSDSVPARHLSYARRVHLLVIDVGNTQTVIGLYDLESGVEPFDRAADSALLDHWRVATNAERTADEYALLFQEFLAFHGFGWTEDVNGFAVCSSVPRVTGALRRFSERYLGFDALEIGRAHV